MRKDYFFFQFNQSLYKNIILLDEYYLIIEYVCRKMVELRLCKEKQIRYVKCFFLYVEYRFNYIYIVWLVKVDCREGFKGYQGSMVGKEVVFVFFIQRYGVEVEGD